MFSDEQRTILLRYFDEYGMTSTHRRNMELMERCANEVGTSLERVKVCIRVFTLCTFVHVRMCLRSGGSRLSIQGPMIVRSFLL